MTNNLGTARIADGQASGQWASSNDADGAHDAAMTEHLALAFTSTHTLTLTALQFISNYSFTAGNGSPVPTAACTLNVPNVNALGATLKRGSFTVVNDLSFDLTVQVSGQARTPPTLSPGQGAVLLMNGTDVVLAVPQGAVGSNGADGISGTSALTRVRVVATSNIDISTALEAGDVIDGVTLAQNDLVLLTGQTAAAENGVYVAVATGAGAASRHADFDTYDELPGTYFSVMEGTAKADTLWRCTSDRGGTIGTTAVAISEFTSGGGVTSNAALVYKSDETGANYTTQTAVGWDLEEYDDNGWHDTVTNNSRLTVPSGVTRVRVSCQLRLTDITAGNWVRVQVNKNGAAFIGFPLNSTYVDFGTWWVSSASGPVDVTAGDYFEVELLVESDTSIGINGAQSWFAIEKLA